MVWQLVKTDDETESLIGSPLPSDFTPVSAGLKTPLLFRINPAVFTHAYMLMGEHASRFGHDLTLYLSTVGAFFARTSPQDMIRIPPTSQDAKKRLSEDLGVALASLFMNRALRVQWQTISQIPLNNKLAKKRPDFEGFDDADRRFLFEAKGTTKTTAIETALGNAIKQVKDYPEEAERKLAIVSFFSTDPRLFDSETFVVDPPMPDIVPPDEETSILLHSEKALQFGGFSSSAVEYVKVLRKYLKEQRDLREDSERQGLGALSAAPSVFSFTSTLQAERERASPRTIRGQKYLGQVIRLGKAPESYTMFLGISDDKLREIEDFHNAPGSRHDEWHDFASSAFSDGTALQIEGT